MHTVILLCILCAILVHSLHLPVYNNTPDYLHFSLPIRFFNSSFSQNISLVIDTGSRDLVIFHNRLTIPSANFDCGCSNIENLNDSLCHHPETDQGRCDLKYEYCEWKRDSCHFKTLSSSRNYPEMELLTDQSPIVVDGQKIRINMSDAMSGRTLMFVGNGAHWNESTMVIASSDIEIAHGGNGLRPPGVQTIESWGDGILGVLPINPRGRTSSIWEITDEPIARFALDLNVPPEPSFMDVNEVNSIWNSSLVKANWFGWIEGSVSSFKYYRFDMFDLEICGMSFYLAHPSSSFVSHYPAMVDTGASCLGLPHDFYEMLLAYAPFSCDNSTLTHCTLDAGVTGQLPPLSFKLHQDGEKFYIPLENLIIDKEGENKLCIYDINMNSREMTSGDNSPFYSPWEPKDNSGFTIAIGTRPLLSLYAQFDVTHKLASGAYQPQMAFANKLDPSTLSDENCIPRAKCVGDQTFNNITNKCEEPPCSDFYFYELDVGTRTCVLSAHFTEVVIIVSVVVLLLEFLFSQAKVQLLQQVRLVCDPI